MGEFKGLAINYNISNKNDIEKTLNIDVEIQEHSQIIEKPVSENIKSDDLYVKNFSKGSVIFLAKDFILNETQLMELSESNKILYFSFNPIQEEVEFQVFENKKVIKRVKVTNGEALYNEGNTFDIEYSGIKGKDLFDFLFLEITGEKFDTKYNADFLHFKHQKTSDEITEKQLSVAPKTDNESASKSSKKEGTAILEEKKRKYKSVLVIIIFILLLSGGILYFIPKGASDQKIAQVDKDDLLFKVDKKYCEKYRAPETSFSCYYSPKFIKLPPDAGEKNQYYMTFNIEENGICSEGITLNMLQFDKNILKSELIQRGILKTTQSIQENEYGFTISESSVEKIKIGDKECLVWRAKGKSSNSNNDEFDGDYLFQHIFFLNGMKKNGLFIIMFANQDSEIKTFEDFNTKGYVSKVLRTLKFEN